ncbi:hypothetical protein CAOG_06114 [Capsaspora owczarzaki ATCC 30864]|uniref:hypothetical protein n=1 Tax=Capsaspora owczarzaki (strain ATCC 30864) TaxID=595528 RepID=UPI0001FE6EC6|nr:hypothetical protein CAOG_06114 [Capsaspora owczarzaki ATCC 30864]|eukprot:XP_004345704.1 hypothetical protein CAOG_06114 [Capsaspora owczarzaki ATCC 30864]
MAHPALKSLKVFDVARLAAHPFTARAATKLVAAQSEIVARAQKVPAETKPSIDFDHYKSILDRFDPHLVATAKAEYDRFQATPSTTKITIDGQATWDQDAASLVADSKKDIATIDAKLKQIAELKPVEEMTHADLYEMSPRHFERTVAMLREYYPSYMKKEHGEVSDEAKTYARSFVPKR